MQYDDRTAAVRGTIGWSLLARYFAGELTAPQHAGVVAWIHEAPGRAEQVEELRRRWAVAAELGHFRDRTDAMWRALGESMRE